ncbi:MAG: hypothetical protein HC929_17430 [Leptolyngbyaceae cyanobacterium SM2_5_2]|nr:hypothetical protein [Leptolyngbyaceae cyanobacterium SM2_5_2]
MSTNVELLETAAKEIKGLADAATRRRYAAALADSLRIDDTGQEPPQVKGAAEIAAAHGVTINNQDEFGIVIRRKKIRDFLRRYGVKVRNSDITLKLKTSAYQSYFDRPISRCGNETSRSPTVYTYAEVLQRFGVNSQIDLPLAVKELFEDEDIAFP